MCRHVATPVSATHMTCAFCRKSAYPDSLHWVARMFLLVPENLTATADACVGGCDR